MLTFVFWNLGRRPLEGLVAELAAERDADIVLLSECNVSNHVLLRTLNQHSKSPYSFAFSPADAIKVFTRFPSDWLKPIEDTGGLSIRHLAHPLYSDILVVGAHLSSKLFRTADDQLLESVRMARRIEEAEQRVGHRRTVLVGDLNMNPFEAGVAAADGFHGVMDRTVAQRESRIVGGQTRPFFYNPMWSRFGDESLRPPGTYYYGSSGQITYFWNLFDQVLLRPALMGAFKNSEMEVISRVGATTLLTGNGLPSTSAGSDHLPLVFTLHL